MTPTWSADWIRESMIRPEWQPAPKRKAPNRYGRPGYAPEPGRAQGLSREEWVELREQSCPICGERIARHGLSGGPDNPWVVHPSERDVREPLPELRHPRRDQYGEPVFLDPGEESDFDRWTTANRNRQAEWDAFVRDLVLLDEAWSARPPELGESSRGGARGPDPLGWMPKESRRRLREREQHQAEYDRNVRAAHTRNEAMIAEAMERRRDFVRSWEAKGWQGQAEARKSDPEGYRAFQEQQQELRHYERKRRTR